MTVSTTKRRRSVAVGILTAVALTAAGCGRDKDNAATTTAAPATTAATTAAPGSSAAPASSAGDSSSTAAPASSAAATTTSAATTTTAAPPGPGDFGTLKAVCGPGDAKGATAQGVTDTEIVVGTASDVGNTVVPGLNQELWDSADAFVGFCNEAGGINGRKLKLIKHDAKLFEAGARMIEACQSDFMLVGGGMALDDTSVEPRLACGLPSINGYATGAVASVAPLQLSPMATSNKWSEFGLSLRLIAASDPSVKNVGIWSSQVPSIQPAANRARRAVPANGFNEVYFDELPAAVDNWRPLIEQLKAADVQILTMYNTPENLAAAMRTMNDVGWFPKYIAVGGNHYNEKLISEAGETLAKTTFLIYTTVYPFEEAAQNPATEKYLELLKQYAGGASPKSLGINAFSAFLLFAESAKACGSDLTRDCVMANAAAAKNWTGGGLHAEGDPATSDGEAPQCFTLLQATPGGFVIDTALLKPNNGIYNCDPKNSEHLPDA